MAQAQRQRALQQVAELARQLRVVRVDQALDAKIAVLGGVEVAQEVVTHRRDAVALDQLERIDRVARRLADLPALQRDEAVDARARRRRQPRAEQERRPVHRVKAQDVLAQQVLSNGGAPAPVALEERGGLRKSERRQVAGERVEPDVDDLRSIARHRDAPVARALSAARHAQVLQPACDEAGHFVVALGGHDAQPLGFQEVSQLVCVARQAKEPVLLADLLQGLAVHAAAAADGVGFLQERLAAGAVASRILARVQIAVRGAAPPQLPHRGRVTRVARGVQVVVQRDVQRVAQPPERCAVLAHQLQGRDTARLRRARVLQAVIVGAAGEAHGPASLPVVPRQRVADQELERVSYVGGGVHVGEGAAQKQGESGRSLGLHGVLVAVGEPRARTRETKPNEPLAGGSWSSMAVLRFSWSNARMPGASGASAWRAFDEKGSRLPQRTPFSRAGVAGALSRRKDAPATRGAAAACARRCPACPGALSGRRRSSRAACGRNPPAWTPRLRRPPASPRS